MINSIRQDFRPQLQRLSNYLDLSGEPAAAAFFRQIQSKLEQTQSEEELLNVFMIMSTSAFQGFHLDPFAVQVADQLLAKAQHYAVTLSADASSGH